MRKIFFLVAVSMVCLMFVSGAIAQPNKFWAMDVGNSWFLNGSNPLSGTWTWRSTIASADTTIPGITIYRQDGFIGGTTLEEMNRYSVGQADPFEIRWLGFQEFNVLDPATVSIDGGLLMGQIPIVIGPMPVQITTGTFNGGPVNISMQATVSFEPVAVPPGTFQTFRIHTEISVTELGGLLEIRDRWFAPYIGIVKDVIQSPDAPQDVDTLELTSLNVATVFSDVPVTRAGPPVTVNPFYQYVMAIYDDGITTGCVAGAYCPVNNVTREQMASFIVRAVDGADATQCTGIVFNDVPLGAPHCANIERLRALNVTLGCGPNLYCPFGNVTRQEMASFLVRAVDGFDATVCTGIPFTDVPFGAPHCANIERLRVLNVTLGCTANTYCPSSNVVRDQMAAFLARAFLGLQ